MQRAWRILHRKRHYDDGTISELTLWLVPNPVRGSAHAFKYSLFYGRAGVRLVGYDNEPGKGDHRHYEGIEEPYEFTTPGAADPGFPGGRAETAAATTIR
jgi:hypothetical protein